jgi:hypothetical protein
MEKNINNSDEGWKSFCRRCLLEIAIKKNNDPNWNGCSFTETSKNPHLGFAAFSLGTFITDEKGPQYLRVLRNSTEKAIRILLTGKTSARDTRNPEKGEWAGGFQFQSGNIYTCSGFKEPVDEGFILIHGTFKETCRAYPNYVTKDAFFNLFEILFDQELKTQNIGSIQIALEMYADWKKAILPKFI